MCGVVLAMVVIVTLLLPFIYHVFQVNHAPPRGM